MTGLIPVTAAPLLDPEQARRDLQLPAGLTLDQMVAMALPGIAEEDRRRLRITLVTDERMSTPAHSDWARIRPRPGARVVIRLVPGNDPILRSVLLVAIAVAAILIAGPLAGVIVGGVASATATAVTAAVLTAVGGLLLNTLVPVKPPEAEPQARSTYRISGWRNDIRPGESIPFILGRHRYAPPFAAPSYTEVVGDQQYLRAMFCFGYGRLDLSDFRLGDTPLSDYEDVEMEIREGVAGDDPLSLYPRQVLEDAIGVELVRPLPRDDAGDVIDGDPAVSTPVIRWTASDVTSVNILFAFQAGLFTASNSGDVRTRTVSIQIRQRPEAGGAWDDVITLEITAKKREAFLRQHGWELPYRGRWQIEITRLTEENISPQISDRVSLAGLQSIRPEYPINMAKPLTLVSLRVRATYQLNGALENFNAIAQRYAPEWDGEAWVDGLTRNPASAYLAALTGPANPFPVTDAGIDLEAVAEWHDWCAAKGLKYDRPHDAAESFGDMLRAICGAGRASPRHDGMRWGVLIDRPQTLAVDHISPRNSTRFSWTRSYFEPPHAMRVAFLDETNGWAPAERLVLWPGHAGDVTLTETLELPGKTDPDEIAIEATRRMLELIHRPDRFTAIQDGVARVATRGDLVMGSFDVLDRVQLAARVLSVEGRLVELDESIETEPGTSYAIRFRVYADAEDSIGESVVSSATPASADGVPGRMFFLAAGAEIPAVGDLVHFGIAGTESLALRVHGVEAGENFSSVLGFVAAAPEIDTLLDAYEPPAWNGRVGAEIDPVLIEPATPRFVEILTGRKGTGSPGGLEVLLAPGTGSLALLAAYRLQHKLAADMDWTDVDVPLAAGGKAISGYAKGDDVELRALAVAVDGTEGPWTVTVSITIGSKDQAIPSALDDDAIEVTGDLGCIRITLATTADAATERVQIYRAPAGDPLNRATHAVGSPFATSPGETLTYVHGDGTRRTRISGGDFPSSAGWTLGANWAVGGGVATHTPGAADAISQADGLVDGVTYRIGFTVSGRTAGDVTPRLTGGTAQAGDAVSADGLALDAIDAIAANDAFELLASSDFDGSIDDVVLYRQTGRCIPAGAYDIYLEPQDLAGVPGPVSGPFSAIVI